MNSETNKTKEPLTPYLELDDVLNNLASRLHDTLGDTFVGLYLQGSLAIGDFDLTSDIDFLIIIAGELTDEQVKLVQDVHNQAYSQENRWVKRLEYSFIPVDTLGVYSSPFNDDGQLNSNNQKFWYFDNGHKDIEQSDHCNTLVTRWTLREKGIAVIGPDIKSLTVPIPPNELRKEIKGTMLGWAEIIHADPDSVRNRFYQSYLVLNYARMLHNLIEGRVDSKLKGAEWAKQNLDPKWIPLIDYCWEERKDTEIHISQPANPEIFDQALAFVQYVVDQAKSYNIPESD